MTPRASVGPPWNHDRFRVAIGTVGLGTPCSPCIWIGAYGRRGARCGFDTSLVAQNASLLDRGSSSEAAHETVPPACGSLVVQVGDERQRGGASTASGSHAAIPSMRASAHSSAACAEATTEPRVPRLPEPPRAHFGGPCFSGGLDLIRRVKGPRPNITVTRQALGVARAAPVSAAFMSCVPWPSWFAVYAREMARK